MHFEVRSPPPNVAAHDTIADASLEPTPLRVPGIATRLKRAEGGTINGFHD